MPDNLRRTLAGLVVAATVVLSACVDSSGDQPSRAQHEASAQPDGARALVDGQKRWDDAAPSSYTMTLDLDCFCPEAGRWRVAVDESGAVAAEPLDERARGGLAGAVPSVEQLSVEQLYDRALVVLREFPDTRVSAHVDERGLPLRASVDAARAVDEEVSWRIEHFQLGG